MAGEVLYFFRIIGGQGIRETISTCGMEVG